MGEFTMTGFKHITTAGAKRYICVMNLEGCVGLLWDMSNQFRVGVLMQADNFNAENYCRLRTSTEEDYQAMYLELFDELLDARFALEYAFTQGLNDIYCSANNRLFVNMNSVTGEEFEPIQFENRLALEVHVLEYFKRESYIGPVVMKVTCTPDDDGECCSPQKLEFEIDGAGDYNFFIDLCNNFEEAYPLVSYERIK